jgi:uncharacterized repeat protein (TIGR01451 family)
MFIALFLMILTSSLVLAATGDISTFAGNGTGTSTGDGGLATSATINNPNDVGVDSAGNVYITEWLGHRVRKVDTSGNITTIVGDGTNVSSGDGGLATSAQVNGPHEVIADSAGNIYIAEAGGHRVRKINTSGIISTVAGTGTLGFSGDGGLATSAQLNWPGSLALDSAGNLYIADSTNQRIRKVNTSGIISTVAGTGTPGFSGDGGLATSAELTNPYSVKVNNAGEIFIADQSNHRVRKVNASGIISTIAGTGVAGSTGDGGTAATAQLNNPTSIELKPGGGLYIATSGDHRVRLIDNSGNISTVAGNGTGGFSGDGGLAVNAQINGPWGIAEGSGGTLYIADTSNNRVRAIEGAPAPSADLEVVKTASAGAVDAGSSLTYTLTVTNNGPDTANNITVTDTLPAGVSNVAPGAGCSGTTTITCTHSSLANSAVKVFTITLDAPSTAGTITNNVSVSANNPADNTSSNDTDSLNTTVNAVLDADLSIAKTASTALPLVGQNFTYTLTVTNNGPDTANSVVVTDTLPAGVTFVSATTGCSGTTTVTCVASTIANAGTAAFDIVVTAPSVFGTISNTASVSASSPSDSVSGNNSDTLALSVGSPPGVPSLSTWGMGVLALMLGAGAIFMRRRRAAAVA